MHKKRKKSLLVSEWLGMKVVKPHHNYSVDAGKTGLTSDSKDNNVDLGVTCQGYEYDSSEYDRHSIQDGLDFDTRARHRAKLASLSLQRIKQQRWLFV